MKIYLPRISLGKIHQPWKAQRSSYYLNYYINYILHARKQTILVQYRLRIFGADLTNNQLNQKTVPTPLAIQKSSVKGSVKFAIDVNSDDESTSNIPIMGEAIDHVRELGINIICKIFLTFLQY